MDRVVVVGAGLAGLQTVVALREKGYAGELVMLGSEPFPPYDRPPLSKAVLLGESEAPFDTTLAFDVETLKVDLRLGVRATGLGDGVLETDRGELPYDGLVVATGAEPVRLPGAGARYLRTRDDASAIRDGLRPDARVVVVGAGWIGAEVATAAARHGCRVVVVEQGSAPVGHALPPEVGSRMVPWYAAAGVELLLDHRVETVAADGVRLAGGQELPADLVVVGVGVRPTTGWLAGSALEVDRGVLVGADLRTSLPRVFAVGDVAARWSARYGIRIRGEHWDDALRAPDVVATNLLSDLRSVHGSGEVATYDPVPYVWSEQFGRMVQYAGHHPAGWRLVWRGDPDTDPTWAAVWLDERSAVVAVLAVDRPRDFLQSRKLAAAGVPVDESLLGDPAVGVRSAVAGSTT